MTDPQGTPPATGATPPAGIPGTGADCLSCHNIDRPAPPNIAGKELFDVRETAHFCGVSIRKVWAMDRDHLIPAPVRLGGSVRWSRRALVKWIDAGCPTRGELLTLQAREKAANQATKTA